VYVDNNDGAHFRDGGGGGEGGRDPIVFTGLYPMESPPAPAPTARIAEYRWPGIDPSSEGYR